MAEKETGLSRDLIIHPGETLNDVLQTKEMPQKELAARTGVSAKHISTVIKGEKPISVRFAQKLSYVLGIDSSFWINLQANYDKEISDFNEENGIVKEEFSILELLKEIVKYLINSNMLKSGLNKATQVLELRKILQVSSLTAITNLEYNGAYRGQQNTKVNPFILFAWRRLCELKTEKVKVEKSLNKELLEKNICMIKKTMFAPTETMQDNLTKIFAECGIAFSIVQHFEGAPVQGFIQKNSSGKVLLCITIRYRYADIFWFTLFHEIAHILHDDYKRQLIDFAFSENECEKKANKAAGNFLIDDNDYAAFVKSRNFSLDAIEKLALKNEVKPYIVIGRLQKDKYLKYSEFSDRKVQYFWTK